MFNRRRFMQSVAAVSAGAAMAPWFNLAAARAAEPPAEKSRLALGENRDYPALTAKVIAALGGMQTFVKKGDKVVIKPNIGWDRSVEQAGNTHPQVIRTLAELAMQAGAAQVLVFDRPCNDPRRCYDNSGIQSAIDAIKDERVRCLFIDDRKFVPIKMADGKALTEWPLYKDALEADCYINVPIAKHHGLTRLTLGLKNVMGVCGGGRGNLHQSIDQKLTDLNLVVKPRLTVIDATRILLRGGPSGGNLADVKTLDTLIASADIVAADAVATTLFGLKPEDIAPTRAAAARGLGNMSLDRIAVEKV